MAYGVILNLENMVAVILGGGSVARRKAASLLEEGALVRVVAPDVHPGVKALQSSYKERLDIICDGYRIEYLEGTDLAIAATSDPMLNLQIHDDCRKRRIWCNNVSDGNASDFSNMSGMERAGLHFFASSKGGAPGRTKELLEELVNTLDDRRLAGLEAYAKLRRRICDEIEAPEDRSRMLKELSQTPMAQMDQWSDDRTGEEDHDHQSRK